MHKNKCKFIFITGGVISSVGKGLTAASIGALLQSIGFKITIRKLDPYLNVDPGTMNPTQHGEVFVTEDGAETDLDLGHYERFTNISFTKEDSITAGKIYSQLIAKERKGDYLGKTVQVIPHVTDLIKKFIVNKGDELDFILCEIGGTVGDIEGQPFFEAIRQIGYDIGKENVAYIHVTLVPYIKASQELKTKPTQHSVKALNSIGIQPDIIICRTEKLIPQESIKKIALFCNVKSNDVIQAPDVKSIYELPIKYKQQKLDARLLDHFNIAGKLANVKNWEGLISKISNIKKNSPEIKIGLIGKYNNLDDAYKSVLAALRHAGIANNLNVNIEIVNSRELDNTSKLSQFNGIIVPGGFGDNGIEGKLLAIRYARENNIPLFAICLGFQLTIVEFAQNILKLEDANSTEFDSKCKDNVIALLSEWDKSSTVREKRNNDTDLGGTMRLGAYDCILKEKSKIHEIYKTSIISERHRHRYEVNYNYKEIFEKNGMYFTGVCKLNNNLVETLELENHPWFIGVQFHPEFKSKIFNPHPLFKDFIAASFKNKLT